MGFLKSVFKTVLDVAVTPVDIIKDVVTLGGALNEEDEPYTVQRLKKIAEDVDEIPDSIDDGLF